MNAPAAEPLWRMSLAGSELARVEHHADHQGQGGDTVLLVFAVAQVRPAQAPRFGAGDDTAYLGGVVLRLAGAVWAADVPDGLVGRLSACDVHAMGNVSPASHSMSMLPLPGKLEGPLTLTLRSALGAEWTVHAQVLSLHLGPSADGAETAWPSLAC